MVELPKSFNLDEANTFIAVFKRCEDQSAKYTSFRELFHGLPDSQSHTTVITHLSEFVGAVLPGTISNSGERLKLLFAFSDNGKFAPTPLAKGLYQRLEALSQFCQDIRHFTQASVRDVKPSPFVVRIAAPPTIALRFLAMAFSAPNNRIIDELQVLQQAPSATEKLISGIRLEMSTGNVEHELLPRLLLGLFDFVVGYGMSKEDVERVNRGHNPAAEVYADPDTPGVSFANLGNPFRMILIYHPSYPPALRPKAKKDRNDLQLMESVLADDIDLGSTTLIASHAQRQCEGAQDLIDKARRYGRFREVETDDEALAMVRMGGGIAIVPEVFEERRVIKSCRLMPDDQFTRRFGIYYPTYRGLSREACWYAEFLRAYMAVYNLGRTTNLERSKRKNDLKPSHLPPAYDFTENKTYPKEVLEKMELPLGEDWQKLSEKNYPVKPLSVQHPT